MFNVGGPEVVVVFLVALIVLGPQQLPKAMRTFGSVMSEIRKVSNGFQSEIRNAMDSVVDVSATEKPQSGTMASPDPVDHPPVTGATTDGTEVVARNDGSTDGDDDADGESRPAIDPADRAAG